MSDSINTRQTQRKTQVLDSSNSKKFAEREVKALLDTSEKVEESSNLIKARINDAYSNCLGGYGYEHGVAENGANFENSRELSWDFSRINRIYRSQPLVAKIANTISFEMTKAGIDIHCELPPDEISYLEQTLRNYDVSLAESANWGLVFGLGASILYLDGEFNSDALSKPLDMSLVTKNSFKGLKTLVRWQGIMPLYNEFVDEISDVYGENRAEDLGEPRYYEVWFLNSAVKYKVHRSRLFLFRGNKLPGLENQIEMGCGVSIVERLWLPLLNYLATINYVQNMLQISQQRVLFLAEGDRIGQSSEEGQREFQRSMTLISKNASVNNMLVLDQNDEFDYKSANFSNLDKIIQTAQEDFSAAANMPLNKLFGKSPTGLNNSSKENLIDFYDFISREQNMQLRPVYERLIPIIYKSKYGKDIPEFSFDFKSLFMPDEQEKALIIDRKTRPVQKAWETNAIRLIDYLQELREIGKVTDCFTNITDDTLSAIKKNNLENARFCDFSNGYIINGEMITDIGTLKKMYKDKQKQLKIKGDGKKNEKNVDNDSSNE